MLMIRLLVGLQARTFDALRTNIQKSNSRMIAIATKLGFRVEENPKSSSTLKAWADRSILESMSRLFSR